jgi:signal transduction histidine kinase
MRSGLLRAAGVGCAVRALAVGMLTFAGGLQIAAAAICRLDLPAAELRELDERTDADPEWVVAEAGRLLEAGARLDAFTAAQLYAIIAEARDFQGRDPQVHEALAAARAELAKIPATPQLERLRLRLRFNELDTIETDPEQLQAGVRELDRLESTLDGRSIEHVCLLRLRGFMHDNIGNVDRAAADGAGAYRLAQELQAAGAQAAAAYDLATAYRRAGLFADAERFIDEVVEYATAHRETAALADAAFTRGQILFDSRQFAKARNAFESARSLQKELGDDFTRALSDRELCGILIEEGDLVHAAAACKASLGPIEKAGRPDQLKRLWIYQARLALRSEHYEEALRILDRTLAGGARDLHVFYQSQAYHDRALVKAALGRDAEAFKDLRESLRLDELIDIAQRSSAVAVTNAALTTERKDAELRVVRAQQAYLLEQARTDRLVRNAVIVLAGILIVGGTLFVRNWRRGGRAESTQRATEARLSTLSRWTGGVAHDFNNLMTVIRQATGLIVRRPGVADDAAALRLMAQVDKAVETAAGITQQLLAFGRQQHLRPEPVELGVALEKARPMLERLVGDGVTFSIEVESPPPVAFVDRTVLAAAVANLVRNSRDAIAQAGTIAVRIGWHAAGDGTARRASIEVADSGDGMTAEVLQRAREPFFTTKPVGSGSGLGLSMVDGFATQSGGELQIESVQGQGTRVSILLPEAKVS